MSNENPLTHNDRFLTRAKQFAASEVAARQDTPIAVHDMYIVWFAKTLGNWKALVSTDVMSGVYVEVTYNGAKHETYVDVYEKQSNNTYYNEEGPETHA